MSERRINEAGYQLVKRHEGLRLTAYLCPAGMYTIGYGHTKNVCAGDTITASEAEEFLDDDLRVFEKGVEGLVHVPLNDNQFSALVSFSFNVGLQALYRSTLLNLLNRGWYAQVPAQLQRWTKAGGKELAGLVKRRLDEAELWKRA
jgi:lysozyme